MKTIIQASSQHMNLKTISKSQHERFNHENQEQGVSK